MKNTVYVGLSGGVDSSVSALLLKQQGYDVTGVFIKTWQPDYIECTWKEDRLDAMRVAAQLDIPFITLDLETEYKEGVVDYMINEYIKGHTPNPDIMCNKEIKFGAFYKYVKSIDVEAMISTGHYATLTPGPSPSFGEGRDSNVSRIPAWPLPKAWGGQGGGSFALVKAKDPSKDQVYFLSQIDRNILSDIIFPLGNMMKSEVRQIAADNNLYVADKKDSQGICMLGDISMKDFLKKEISMRNIDAPVHSSQSDLIYYTIGERIDFNINEIKNLNFKVVIMDEEKEIKNINQKPYYVINKKIEENTLYISINKIENNKSKVYKIESWNYTSNIELKENNIYEGQTRYHGEIYKFKVVKYEQAEKSLKHKLEIEVLDENTLMVSGQTIVLYEGDIMIGGGIIK